MPGFGKVTFIGEYFNQRVINVFHYRSTAWLPLQGNPFDDVLAFVDSCITHQKPSMLAALPSDYTLRTVEGIGYDDQYNIVTASPLIRTVNEAGLRGGTQTMGAASCAILSLRCGPQVQINGAGQSKRNRGYLAIGPLNEADVDNYSHIVPLQVARIGSIGDEASANRTIIAPAVTLIPIRIHEKYAQVGPIKALLWRTYSDVLGYKVNAVASYRKSRQPEA
jgi:hypothetical protein